MPRVLVTTLAAQGAVVVRPSSGATSRLIVICHGADWTYEYPTVAALEWAPLQETMNYLVERGYAVVCPALLDTSLSASPPTTWGQTFGNNVSTTLLSDVITAAQALADIGSGKIALFGISMGNMTIFNYCRRFGQSNVAGILGIVPVCDSEWQYVSNGAKPQMDLALGAATYQSTYDPKVIASTITVPWLGWTNTADTSAPPAQAVTLAGLIPGGLGSTESRGAGGHDFTGCDGQDAHAWLDTLNWA